MKISKLEDGYYLIDFSDTVPGMFFPIPEECLHHYTKKTIYLDKI